ncbi:2-oxoglutarate dehydrogenase E1 component [Acetobacteraceae bacterium]|nr:2-oxoglutarate dehydrogenase E1 component [Acetobacteraceae bacterium]
MTKVEMQKQLNIPKKPIQPLSSSAEKQPKKEIDLLGGANALYLENLESDSQNDPATFQPFPPIAPQRNIFQLPQACIENDVDIWRRYGWRTVQLDPLERKKIPDVLLPLMEKASANLQHSDSALLKLLRNAYGKYIGAEFMHLENPEERQWWIDRFESSSQREVPLLSSKEIYTSLYKTEFFEKFCHRQFPALRRFSLEGSESLAVAIQALMKGFTLSGGEELIVGLSHRGRVNLLGGTLGAGWECIFGEFLSKEAPEGFAGGGDVKYHLGFQSEIGFENLKETLAVTILPNPSHLEAVDAVSLGYVRAKQDLKSVKSKEKYAALLIHGDTAFAGQGVVYESFQMNQLSGYKTGGTIHVIVNNQVGFTLSPEEAYSGSSCASLGKAFEIPILHINADHPEEIVKAMQWAVAWRQTYQRDIIIDLIGYRRLGHNETDDASFTQPLAVEAIRNHPGVVQKYAQQVFATGALSENEAEVIKSHVCKALEESLEAARKAEKEKERKRLFLTPSYEGSASMRDDRAPRIQPMTGIPFERIRRILSVFDPEKIAEIWPGSRISPRLSRFLAERKTIRDSLEVKAFQGEMSDAITLDWSTAEALALGSIVLDGHGVRLAGEDSARGTFSHRHLLTTDQESGERFSLLGKLGYQQGRVEIVDSLLSEYAAMGFEYGYGLGDPNILGIWEAQFGDFANGAQIIIDQFIVSGEEKWNQLSSLVLLLPHGHEGGGPEHSSARIERYLQLGAQNNVRICMPSSPASYFHLLRRQKTRRCPKPLILFSPKSLLRRKAARSALREIGPHTRFEPILRTQSGEKLKQSRRLILCSGKIFYDLEEALEKEKIKNVGFLRLEQFYPFPLQDLITALQACDVLQEIVWVQEEPENMGARSFILPWILEALQRAGKETVKLYDVARTPTSGVASGWIETHQKEQREIVVKAFGRFSP